MSKITTVIAGDSNFRKYVDKAVEYCRKVGYDPVIYDLGGLGYGTPFEGRVSPQVGAKIPSKPGMIMETLKIVDEGDYVVWIDADALIEDRIDEIMFDYDIGVTVRQPKQKENSLPINAGIVFVRKTPAAIKFVEEWIKLCETGVSDQQELNKLCQVTTKDTNTTVVRNNTSIHVFECRVYNNFYFAKKATPHAKIKHYKSKLRDLWPKGEL
jgi:hypothetical protein